MDRVCKKCLLREFNEAMYQEKLEKIINMIEKDSKTEDSVYENRLALCKECEKLLEGTCLSCGCYVELRAATKISHCPLKKW